jgi:adenosylmethionine-8-amino-7-oxononanoate aminotransferase
MACARELERVIQFEDPNTVAAFIAEPIQAAGGVIVPPPGYLEEVWSICERYDVLFIADEVVTGFGRLGSWTGSRHYHIQPDVMTFAKGVTSGYFPLGVSAVSSKILNAFTENSCGNGPEFRHGNTYSAHPVACAAALANIDILERENLVDAAKNQGQYLAEKLQDLAREFPDHVDNVACEGLLGRLELKVQPGEIRGGKGERVEKLMRQQGVIVRAVGDVITFSPPFIITRLEIDQIITALRKALSQYQ